MFRVGAMNILTIFHYVSVPDQMCYNLNPEGLHPSIHLSASGFTSHLVGYTWLPYTVRTFVSNALSRSFEISVKPALVERSLHILSVMYKDSS